MPPGGLSVSVHLLPKLIGEGTLRGGVAVIVDVLRASTAMVHALAAGCESVIPCGEIDEARRIAQSLPAGQAILGGEREGLPIPGFDLGNSPGSFTPEICKGKILVITTTNGTRAILASLEAERVLVAAFPNAGAIYGALARQERPVHVVCSGTEGHVSTEDTLLAGALVENLVDDGRSSPALANDGAIIAASHWREAMFRVEQGEPLSRIISYGRGGRRVRELGLDADIEDAAYIGRFGIVAELRRDPLRIVAANEATTPR